VSTTLYLIRHGESKVTVQRVVGGELSCTGLSPTGWRQAEALRDRLMIESPQVDVLISSTLPRAVETAEALLPALGVGLQVDPDLVEHRPGAADGCPFDEFDRRFGLFDFRAEPDRPFAPGGESMRQFHERVLGALRRIEDLHAGRSVMIVCHGGVIDIAFRHYLSIGITSTFDLWTLNTSITEFVVPATPARPQLRRYNDAAHLADLD